MRNIMTNDRKIVISASTSLTGAWSNQETTISEFYARLSTTVTGSETMEEFMKLPKSAQLSKKDVGGFVGGKIKGNKRTKNTIEYRDLITFDIDETGTLSTDDVIKRVDSLGYNYMVCSTRKHTPSAPRLRVIIPLDVSCTPEEYIAIARRLAHYIDSSMSIFDHTTFQPERLMFYPSKCKDSEFICVSGDKPLAPKVALLATYAKWTDMSAYPKCPQELEELTTQRNKEAEKPTNKKGIVGAFCRAYGIREAIAMFLQDTYAEADMADRYTYLKGSSARGVMIYDNDFAYSHHATDIISGRLVNAYDLVRLNLFGSADEDCKRDTPLSKLPSTKLMREFCVGRPEVQEQLKAITQESIHSDFGNLIKYNEEHADKLNDAITQSLDNVSQNSLQYVADANTCMSDASDADSTTIGKDGDITFKILYDKNGKADKTLDNMWSILELDPLLQGRIYKNVLTNSISAKFPLPWSQQEHTTRDWQDEDDDGLLWYIEKAYKVANKNTIMSAVNLCAKRHTKNPIIDYLRALPAWDGVPRMETLFIDYLGAKDNAYTRTVTRKSLKACLARAYNPGCKYDNMLVLVGSQGIGKSTLLSKIGKDWYKDNLNTFMGDKAKEAVRGAWVVEYPEMVNLNKTDSENIKNFLSQSADEYRPAYARRIQKFLRTCVIFGTTNDYEFLRDMTGNRRFLPVDCGEQAQTKSVFKDLDGEVAQIWAETIYKFKNENEILALTGDEDVEAKIIQDEHRHKNQLEKALIDFLEKEVPDCYNNWEEDQRREYDTGIMIEPANSPFKLVPRTEFYIDYALMIILGCRFIDIGTKESADARRVVAKHPEWVKVTRKFGTDKRKRGFKKVD